MKIYNEISKDYIMKCAELYVKVFNAAPWNDKWTVETATKRLSDIVASPNFIGVAAEEDGLVIGAVFGNFEQFFDGIHYNLREMFVSNELQGKGLGSTLLEELEIKLKNHGVTEIILFTSKGNKTSKFYEKNGFLEFSSMAMMGKEIK